MDTPQVKEEGGEAASPDELSSVKRKLAAAKLQDEKYEQESKEAQTAELFRRLSQQVVSVAVTNAVERVSGGGHK